MAKQSSAKKTVPQKPLAEITDQQVARTKEKSAAPNLDRLIHERLRLGIISALAANESLTFSDLKKLMNTTDGNLSVHARKLEEAGYISCTKFFEGRLPKTEYKLTAAGRSALEKYLSHMESLIKQMRNI
ncbi:MAG TPA: transcriptional regulator [Pyrinomonadaceae bacterium]|nr:transcriptional regulator [Pyrinomonadaceae bacterium]